MLQLWFAFEMVRFQSAEISPRWRVAIVRVFTTLFTGRSEQR